MMMHAFTGNLPAAVKQVVAAPGETLPVPFASAGRGGSVCPVPVCGHSCFANLMDAFPGSRPISHASEEDRIFSVTKNCTTCGTCIAVCSVGNIEMLGKKPAWKHHCELCLACIRTCPAQAIRVGDKRAARPQYRHT